MSHIPKEVGHLQHLSRCQTFQLSTTSAGTRPPTKHGEAGARVHVAEQGGQSAKSSILQLEQRRLRLRLTRTSMSYTVTVKHGKQAHLLDVTGDMTVLALKSALEASCKIASRGAAVLTFLNRRS